MKYIIEYYWIQSDHILATPDYGKSETVECNSIKELDDYLSKQHDPWNKKNYYKKATEEEKKMFGFDYISRQGGVKIEKYKSPKFKKI